MKDADSKAWETYQLSSGMEMSTVRSVAPLADKSCPLQKCIIELSLTTFEGIPELISRRSVDFVNHVSFRGKLNESMQLKVT